MNFIPPTVDIINPAFQSTEGRLFAGTSPLLNFSSKTSAWASLCNPCDSDINLFLSFFSITNFSDSPFTANLFLNAKPPGLGMVSSDVGNLNLGFANDPEGILKFDSLVEGRPIGGTRVAAQRVPSHTTSAVFRVDGRIIVVPGTSILIFLTSENQVTGEIEFEWFENEKIF